jgi:hypothetical protein
MSLRQPGWLRAASGHRGVPVAHTVTVGTATTAPWSRPAGRGPRPARLVLRPGTRRPSRAAPAPACPVTSGASAALGRGTAGNGHAVLDFKNLNDYPCTCTANPGASLAGGKPVTRRPRPAARGREWLSTTPPGRTGRPSGKVRERAAGYLYPPRR